MFSCESVNLPFQPFKMTYFPFLRNHEYILRYLSNTYNIRLMNIFNILIFIYHMVQGKKRLGDLFNLFRRQSLNS